MTAKKENVYQVTFSDQSMEQLNKLPTDEQLILMEKLTGVTPQSLKKPSGDLGKFQREGMPLYRLRASERRIYFEVKDDSILYCHYIVPKHTLSDFVVRFKLPVTEEQLVEEHQSFWKYLDTLK